MIGGVLSSPYNTALPAEYSFLDNPYVRTAAIISGIAILCFLTPPFLVFLMGGIGLVDRAVSYITAPLLIPASHLPALLQLAISVVLTVGAYFSIEACKGGIQRWTSFFNPRDPQNQKNLFWGVRILTGLIRRPAVVPSPYQIRAIVDRTITTPIVDTIFFDLFLTTIGVALITQITSPTVRAIAERVFSIAVAILYGFSHFMRASVDRLFAGVINGVYAEFINRPALEEHGPLASWSARSANGCVAAAIGMLFSGLKSLFVPR